MSARTVVNIWMIIILIAVLSVISIVPLFNTVEYSNLTVIDKSYSGKTDGYIVWFEDSEGTPYEFVNEDEFLYGKFNSSTVQGKLKEGSVYNIKTVGWRIPFLSSYPNIVQYELVEGN